MTNVTVKKVERAKLSACLTCLLCNTLFRDATTISECLHTFCRECICKKITDEGLKQCPVCNADLGCAPLDKLRADHSLQDLRDKIFPSEGQNSKTPEKEPSLSLLTKRKHKSQSSLRANAPKLSSHSSIFARRAKVATRKVFTPPSTSKPDKVADDKKDEKHSGVEILDEVFANLSARRAKAAARKKFIPIESTPTCEPEKVTGDDKKEEEQCQLEAFNETSKIRVQDTGELCKDEADKLESLNNLVEAGKTRPCKSTMQENPAIQVPFESCDNDSPAPKVEVKKTCHRRKASGDIKDCAPSKSDSAKQHGNQTAKITEDLNFPAQQSVVGSNSTSDKVFSSIWFSLVASEEKEVGARLPQISSCYLRVKDGSLSVSFIKKYLVKKLDLASEAEVEILLQGQPVSSSLQLQNLVDMWLQTMPTSERIITSVGSSAEDFIMGLSYCRKFEHS